MCLNRAERASSLCELICDSFKGCVLNLCIRQENISQCVMSEVESIECNATSASHTNTSSFNIQRYGAAMTYSNMSHYSGHVPLHILDHYFIPRLLT